MNDCENRIQHIRSIKRFCYKKILINY